MFIYTAKLTRRSIAAALIVLGVLLCGVVMLTARARGPSPADEVSGGEIPVAAEVKPAAAATNAERVAFLEGCGWKVSGEPVEFQEVLLPEVFTGVFLTYNELQRSQGYDLLPLKGQRVSRYAYTLLNHPDDQSGYARANLLVYKGVVVGGDVLTTSAGGELYKLARGG